MLQDRQLLHPLESAHVVDDLAYEDSKQSAMFVKLTKMRKYCRTTRRNIILGKIRYDVDVQEKLLQGCRQIASLQKHVQ